MKLSEERKAQIKRVFYNAMVLAGAAAITVFLETLKGIDFGEATPIVTAAIGLIIKMVQAFAEPAP